MKLDRRTVLAGAAAAFAAPIIITQPARADAKRQSLVDSCLASATKVLSASIYNGMGPATSGSPAVCSASS